MKKCRLHLLMSPDQMVVGMVFILRVPRKRAECHTYFRTVLIAGISPSVFPNLESILNMWNGQEPTKLYWN